MFCGASPLGQKKGQKSKLPKSIYPQGNHSRKEVIHSGKLTWQMENPPFEDVFPIEHGDIPLLCSFTRVCKVMGCFEIG